MLKEKSVVNVQTGLFYHNKNHTVILAPGSKYSVQTYYVKSLLKSKALVVLVAS